MSLTRRDSLALLSLGSAAAFVTAKSAFGAQGGTAGAGGGAAGASPAIGGAAGQAAAASGAYEPKPLPFDPKKLNGISEKMIVSHHDNNYAGAVKNLNKMQEQLAGVNKDTPGFLVSGLKERELQFTNSMILHENYFANLGGSGKAGGAIATAVGERWGSLARWEEDFRAVGASLGGGSGWCVLALDLHTGRLHTYWAGNHTQALSAGIPLLVMDMYEHAYQMDYGAAAAKYIDAFMQNVQWEEVDRRYERALATLKAWKG